MKTIDKQQFAKLLFNLCANYMELYQYDAFYDIPKIRKIETDKENTSFFLYVRKTGFDMRFETVNPELHDTYLRNNHLCLYVIFTFDRKDANSHLYTVTIVKDSDNFIFDF